MNILLVGNGFDLSHYLPTKYDHFMVATDAIEKWDETKGDMGFDDLFGSLYEKEDYFFGYTKAMYKTDEIKISVDQVKGVQEQLKENVWYQYFSEHVKNIKTWIDFELKIAEALDCICRFLVEIDKKFESFGDCNVEIYFLDKGGKKEVSSFYLSNLDCEKLSVLKLINKNSNYGELRDLYLDSKLADIEKGWFYSSEQTQYGFSKEKYLSFLIQELEGLINLFNFYLLNIIVKLSPKSKAKIISQYWLEPDKIYSFNYTNTYQRLYNFVDVEYLHGSHGEFQNIVLGVSDLDDDALKKLKAYGFTKYHQKLFKDTDYLFLDEHKNKILSNRKNQIDLYEQRKGENRSAYRNALNNRIKNSETMLDLNFYIWGHSLDVSDKDYIIDLFSLNDEVDRNVRVVIYHYGKPAKFSLLNNLLAILGKDKVEQWMKNKWLEFKPNPEVKFEIDSNLEEAS